MFVWIVIIDKKVYKDRFLFNDQNKAKQYYVGSLIYGYKISLANNCYINCDAYKESICKKCTDYYDPILSKLNNVIDSNKLIIDEQEKIILNIFKDINFKPNTFIKKYTVKNEPGSLIKSAVKK